MISRSIKVTYGFEPPRSGAASPSSVRNPYLTFLFSRIHLRFKPFGALAVRRQGQEAPRAALYPTARTRGNHLRTAVKTRVGNHAKTAVKRTEKHPNPRIILSITIPGQVPSNRVPPSSARLIPPSSMMTQSRTTPCSATVCFAT